MINLHIKSLSLSFIETIKFKYSTYLFYIQVFYFTLLHIFKNVFQYLTYNDSMHININSMVFIYFNG